VVRGSLQKVNSLAKLAEAKRNAYEKGEEIPLTDVVLAMQKSSLAFEATLQIRNKVLRAYEEVLNMPV
jgi:flagellar hook-basal body complex protein FliE